MLLLCKVGVTRFEIQQMETDYITSNEYWKMFCDLIEIKTIWCKLQTLYFIWNAVYGIINIHASFKLIKSFYITLNNKQQN